MSATDTAKFTRMHEFLDTPIEQIIASVDAGGAGTLPAEAAFSPALLAGLSAAKVLLAHAQYDEMGEEREGGWDSFRARLQFVVSAATDAEDAGTPSQFGLWDGLHAALVEAGRIDGNTVLLTDAEASNAVAAAMEETEPRDA